MLDNSPKGEAAKDAASQMCWGLADGHLHAAVLLNRALIMMQEETWPVEVRGGKRFVEFPTGPETASWTPHVGDLLSVVEAATGLKFSIVFRECAACGIGCQNLAHFGETPIIALRAEVPDNHRLASPPANG